MSNLVIALDFDGTLCQGNLFPDIGEPRMWLINQAIEWRKTGHKVILWTCREDILETDYSPYWSPGLYLTDAIDWCKQYGLEFDAVNMNLTEVYDKRGKASRKIFAHYYIDDKSIIFDDTNEMIFGVDGIMYA